ncbi:hypothetical protein M2272_005075 [Mycobacterium frederiksbergense]|uniref:Uncharacterized protein n=1 Tax=Mycolicibacterium frederiksbergense TaxID=117567 RepID=A0ABT6L642_9MYCO|nr:hypothetical protein [Mycolicibacterium frederiksbergense]MDH6198416.1 hypothetical protein [Mycolicibacterium frederiksbergense]
MLIIRAGYPPPQTQYPVYNECWIVIRITARDGAGTVRGRLAKAWASRA